MDWVVRVRNCIWLQVTENSGLPRWISSKTIFWQCKRSRKHGFDPRDRNIPWRRKWQPTPVFLPGKSQGQIRLTGYSPWGHKRVGHNKLVMDRRAAIHGVAKSRTRLSDWTEQLTQTFFFKKDFLKKKKKKTKWLLTSLFTLVCSRI